MRNYFQHEQALVSSKAKIGENTRIWAFVNIQDGAVIGKECNICDGCYVEKGAVIGDHVTIKNGVAVYEGVILEDDVFCGTNVAFINDRYPRSHRSDAWTLEKTCVKKGATIGSNSTIMCGVTIGAYALIGAGSVVTRDINNHWIVTGNPAKPVGYACCCGRRLPSTLTCIVCKLHYVLEGDELHLKTRKSS
ncbi:MAG: N-acetyltransferase [Candidatus Omnitrophica bacterium]|nr:N-acetyltransferase [Candidatus Omnitrophota bacterium]